MNASKKHGDPLKTLTSKDRVCRIEGCGRRHCAKSYCRIHYRRWRACGDPNAVKINRGEGDTLAERFWSRVNIKEPDYCWLWQASRGRQDTPCIDRLGYGQLNVYLYGRLFRGAHRIAFALFYERDPGEFQVCHTCDNPPCCNPHHLFLGTRSDNMQDMVIKGRSRNQFTDSPTSDLAI